ncbi:hypothetical protein WKG85_10105 [Pantoea agglomerans]
MKKNTKRGNEVFPALAGINRIALQPARIKLRVPRASGDKPWTAKT